MFLRILDRLEEILIASLMALATFIIFLAVMHRYLVGIPAWYPILFPINLSWAQELCIYMFVWWRSSARPMACAPAFMSASTSWSTG